MPATPAIPTKRIISLVPSATETIYWLGLGDALVGRSHVCNYPPSAKALPILTRPELSRSSSRGIHDEVRARLSEGLAIFDLDLDRLRTLAPTHLLVQDQCSVCAVSPSALEGALADWLDPAPTLLRLAPHHLADVWRDIDSIGRVLDCAPAARALRENLSHRLSDLAEATGLLRFATGRPRVACIEWLDPLMIAGHWVPELVRLAGGQPVLAQTGGPSRVIDLAELEAAQPDVLVVQPCGFDLAATRTEWTKHSALAAAVESWSTTRGTPVRIALADGDAYFNRPGPRLVESAEVLAEIFFPNGRPRTHAGEGWVGMLGFEPC